MTDGVLFAVNNFNIQVDNDVQKEQNNKDFLEYIALTMSREMFPVGKPEEVRVSGIAFNYAYLGAVKGRQQKGCTKAIEQISASRRRLYWNAKSYGKKVVGLVHEAEAGDWVIPQSWIAPEKNEEVMIILPTYEASRCNELGGRFAWQCTKQDTDFKSLTSFLSSFKATRKQTLEENSEFCMKCLFLFYPSLLNEFCSDLMKWCHGGVMGETEYAQIIVILQALLEYLKLLNDLKPLKKGDMPLREIVNVLNSHRLKALSYKIVSELKDDKAKDTYKGCLKENVCRGIRSTYSIDKFELEVDQSIRGGRELIQILWDIRKQAESIREM